VRQQNINKKYLMSNPTKSLETTGMYVFNDKSSLMNPVGPHMSYLGATKSKTSQNDRKKKNSRK